jgi:hypothetical protein
MLPRGAWIARAAIAVAAGAVLALGAASVAEAKGEYKYWNSASNPLYVSGFGSWAKAYGQWRVADSSNGTRAFLDSYTWYNNADNHKKYAWTRTWLNSGYCAAASYLSCTASYYKGASAETPHSNRAAAEWLYASTGLSGSANYARAEVRVCLDIPLRGDPCSGSAFTSGTAY